MGAAEPSALPSDRTTATTRVAIVGGSARAAAVGRLLGEIPGVSLVSICSRSTEPAGRMAQEAGIPLVADPLLTLSSDPPPDIVLDLAEDVVTRTALESALPPNTELLSGSAADLIWSVLGQRHSGDRAAAGDADASRFLEEALGRARRLDASNDALLRANRDLEARLAEVYFMHEFVKALVAYHRVDDVSSVIVDACAGILGAEVAAVYVLDRERWVLCLAQSQGRPAETLAHEIALDDPLIGRALADGIAVDVNTQLIEARSAWLGVRGGVRTQAAVPLRAGGEPIGAIVLGWSHQRELDTSELERLHVMADQSALSLQNALLHAELEQLSVTDRLTELFNHGYLQQRLDQELGRAGRFGHALSVIMLDIDDFKAFNDRYGHLVGDDVLRAVSALVRESLREMDVAARYGGEEFAVIVPETDSQGARAVAERIRQSVSAHVFLHDSTGGEVHTTVSVGVATFPGDGRSVEALIHAADAAMYRAKRAGKDRVVVSDSD